MGQKTKSAEQNTQRHEEWPEAPCLLSDLDDNELEDNELEEGLPKWLQEAFEEPDDAPAPAIIIPYMDNEFLDWLVEYRRYDRKHAKTILSNYATAYEKLHEELQIDLYSGLKALQPETWHTGHKPEIVNEFAVNLVAAYVEMIEEELKDDPKSFSLAEQRAILAYHDFISWVGGLPESYPKKTWSFPLAEEFLEWLTPKHADAVKAYENSRKAVSSVRCLGVLLDATDESWESRMHELAATKDKDSRERLEEKIKQAVYDAIKARPPKSRKSVSNGLSNLHNYFIFLNQYHKTK